MIKSKVVKAELKLKAGDFVFATGKDGHLAPVFVLAVPKIRATAKFNKEPMEVVFDNNGLIIVRPK